MDGIRERNKHTAICVGEIRKLPNYVAGVGSHQAKLLIVGEAPGKYEDESGVPFVGPTGEMLNEYLYKAGTSRSECYITNVVKYRPPMNDFEKLHLIGVDVNQSIEELWQNEIRRIKPNCILAVGDRALQALTGLKGILDYRGSILRSRDGDYKVVPTIHPAALFNRASSENSAAGGGLDWTYTKLIQHDITRAVEESLTKEFNLPDRSLEIAHNSLDLYKFFREYEKLDKAASDIESINCVPVCVGFAFNKHHAISIPLLRKIGNINLTDMGDNELDECWRMIYKELLRLKLIGHNFKYDEFKLSLIGFSLPQVYSDTLIKTRVIFPELPLKKLSTVASLWTREPFYKDEGKEFQLGKRPIEQLLKYNAKDCAVEFEVDEEQEQDLKALADNYSVPLVDYYYNYMMRKHKAYLRMENIGFLVDNERKINLKTKYTELEAQAHDKLVSLVGHEINVKSVPQVYNLLYKEMKFKARKVSPTGEDSIVAILGTHAKKQEHKDILNTLLEERRIRDQKSRYINFSPDYDGTCKTIYNISATETCRSSTGILQKPVRPKKIGLAFHTISTHGRLAKDIKSMFIPRKGKVFIKADSSQAEARVVAVLSRDWELLEAFDKVDIHRRTAALLFMFTQKLELSPDFHHPIVDILEKDGAERFCGKKTRHAGNYKMGPLRFQSEFNTDAQKFEINMSISAWRAKQMLELFHAASPKLEKIFWADIKDAIDSTRTLIDPFGGVRIFNGRMDESLYGEGYANIPQRTVAHLVQGALIKINDEIGWDNKDAYFIGEKHDELIMEVPENDYLPYARLLKKHMEFPIDFSTYCSLKRDYILTIPCDVEISDTHYGNFRKIKLETVAA